MDRHLLSVLLRKRGYSVCGGDQLVKDVGVILDRHNIDFTPQCVTVSMNPIFFPVKFGMKTVIPEQVILSANTNAEMLCGSTVRLLVHSHECDACAWGERVRVGGYFL